jgi:hypothetical protein
MSFHVTPSDEYWTLYRYASASWPNHPEISSVAPNGAFASLLFLVDPDEPHPREHEQGVRGPACRRGRHGGDTLGGGLEHHGEHVGDVLPRLGGGVLVEEDAVGAIQALGDLEVHVRAVGRDAHVIRPREREGELP